MLCSCIPCLHSQYIYAVLLLQFPAVNHPQSLERRYLGILSGVLLDLMKVGKCIYFLSVVYRQIC